MAEPNVLVVPVDPYHPTTSLLIPVVTQRILQFAREHVCEVEPEALAREIMARLYAGDPRVTVVALVDAATSRVVGHGVATIEQAGSSRWVFVSQMKADGNVGDAVRRGILMADEWGKGHGAAYMVMSTPRSDASWRRKYGFETMRHLMIRKVGEPIEGKPAEEGEA